MGGVCQTVGIRHSNGVVMGLASASFTGTEVTMGEGSEWNNTQTFQGGVHSLEGNGSRYLFAV